MERMSPSDLPFWVWLLVGLSLGIVVGGICVALWLIRNNPWKRWYEGQ